MTLHCKHCGAEGIIQVNVLVQAPGRMYFNLPKAAFRRADVEILGIEWKTADFVCGNPKCGRVDSKMDSYVTMLEDRIKELELQLKEYEGCQKS